MSSGTYADLHEENELVEISVNSEANAALRASVALTEQSYVLPRESKTMTIETDYGVIYVTIEGNLKSKVIVTYHDIGLNHRVCFGPVFGQESLQDSLQRFCIVHVDAPGHSHESTPFEQATACTSMLDLANQLSQVIDHLGIEYFIGFGAGAGGNVLLHYAVSHRSKMMGLILVGAVGTEASVVDRSLSSASSYFWSFIGSSTPLQSSLLSERLSEDFMEKKPLVVERLKKDIEKIPVECITKMSEMFAERSNILPHLRALRVPVIMFVGEFAPNFEEQVTTMSSFNPRYVTWIKIDECGALVNIERPKALVSPLRLWFNGF
eukprot:TRINITY_DN6672_c0_g1_i3.p1 TRINITY_DN6672_c0_g1~~TRINITY_DN6672_c0_g1_i3.p1  ORF type:complete len:323 (+),score=62.40 TRINITY_DN6672_c0_g1_i3:48-1016(+)